MNNLGNILDCLPTIHTHAVKKKIFYRYFRLRWTTTIRMNKYKEAIDHTLCVTVESDNELV